jgi:hypothetical protein
MDISARDLDWDGCDNVRDLGGLPTTSGDETVRGRVIRANNLDLLTPGGWQALWDYGVRTVIDLRNVEECRPDVARPNGLTMVRIPFDAYASPEWIRRWDPPGLPQNLGRYLTDYPQAITDLGKSIASARPGGIVVHCAAGRDRTGLAAMLLLVHAGVDRQIAAADWEHSFERLGDPAPEELPEARRQVTDFLAAVRTESYFNEEVRARLL